MTSATEFNHSNLLYTSLQVYLHIYNHLQCFKYNNKDMNQPRTAPFDGVVPQDVHYTCRKTARNDAGGKVATFGLDNMREYNLIACPDSNWQITVVDILSMLNVRTDFVSEATWQHWVCSNLENCWYGTVVYGCWVLAGTGVGLYAESPPNARLSVHQGTVAAHHHGTAGDLEAAGVGVLGAPAQAGFAVAD
jgi:hypothetical protein